MAVKLTKVRRLDCIQLDANDRTYFTKEGYLVDHPILTSVGIFEYINPDGSIRRELRLPEYVFDEKSLETYRGKPIIITHEAGAIDKNNVDKEQIGTILSNGYPDGDDIRAEIIIHNTDAMRDSGLNELSLGYTLELIEKPGEWKGQKYDAIQTNIVINHLALVASARAGEQARLNIDGSEEPELKGGKSKMAKTAKKDGGPMSPEELQKAVEAYRARKAGRKGEQGKTTEEPETTLDGDETGEEEPTTEQVTDGDGDCPEEGTTPEGIVKMVKDRRDRRDEEDDPKDVNGAMGIIAQQDEDIDMLLACLEKFFAEEKEEGNQDGEGCEGEENKDSSDDKSQSLNADSADDIIRQRLSICRIGDKLRLDGLENKSILEGKKAIIKKVFPTMRLDGKSRAYIDASYDLAVGEVNKRKGVDYQRQQMMGGQTRQGRADSNSNVSMAVSARQRMIEREGGEE